MAIEKLETFLKRNNVKFDSNLKDRVVRACPWNV